MIRGESELVFIILGKQKVRDRTPMKREYKLSGSAQKTGD
jgi:hypothetical protein